ncbi:hypothetical protein HMPREF1008_00308 [Olsenella sp. oral taxon 809 str. F0356]|uniref:GRP family sugar transporter n=1 Tax=Olsenella sp. oral taxon 809 TaxID=661086 RepID=UPI000231F2B0|nr:GRP family sugar transporter [Olsenella sp. oral taxon 809]EHF02663.1 hypothetical protein HMPREF1008_00308 [Olsenella sp. oral taxon 809 str. F0356]
MLAILVGLVPAFGFGLMGCVSQLVGGSVANKQLGLALPTLPLALVMSLVRPVAWSSGLVVAAAIDGIAWSASEALLLYSFGILGVSRSVPVSTGVQLLGTSAIGVLFLGEWRGQSQLALGLLALVLVAAGVVLCSREDASAIESAASRPGHEGWSANARGMACVMLSAGLSVAYASTSSIFAVDALDLLLPQSLFMVASSFAVGLVSSKGRLVGSPEAVLGRKTWENMLAGALFAIANACVLLSNQMNGLAVGWTLAQMNVIVSTVGGLVLLHEHRSARGLAFVVTGMALVAFGGVLIGLTKA